MLMDIEQSEGTSAVTECLSDPEHDKLSPHSPKTHQTDKQRAKSLPVDLYQDESFSHKNLVRGKRVQFADMMGLNLANIRHFDISDDANETCDVWTGLRHHPPNQELQHGSLIPTRLVPAFDMPVSLLEFDMKSSRLGVALESVTITASEVKGVIRVIQSKARREVGVRYTVNNWLTFSDIQAVSRLNEEKVLQWELFDFILHAPLFLNKDSSVHFAVYCRTDLGEYWDNNDGENYTLKSA